MMKTYRPGVKLQSFIVYNTKYIVVYTGDQSGNITRTYAPQTKPVRVRLQ